MSLFYLSLLNNKRFLQENDFDYEFRSSCSLKIKDAGGKKMFYRRKYYIVKNEFVEEFNRHFKETNLPNQLSNGTRFIGRWMKKYDESTTEIFAIWEYDSYEEYIEIETKIRQDQDHLAKIKQWYEQHGGRDYVLSNYIVEVKDEDLISTV